MIGGDFLEHLPKDIIRFVYKVIDLEFLQEFSYSLGESNKQKNNTDCSKFFRIKFCIRSKSDQDVKCISIAKQLVKRYTSAVIQQKGFLH